MTRFEGPRSAAAIDRQLERRAVFDRHVDRMLADPPAGSTWHPLYRWPSDTDDDYAARVAHFRARQRTTQTTDRNRGRHRGDTHRRTT